MQDNSRRDIMKHKYTSMLLMAVLFVFIFSSVSAQQKNTAHFPNPDENKDKVIDVKPAPAPKDMEKGVADIGDEKPPLVVLPEPVHEFGSILEGKEIVHDFVIRNEGEGELKIARVRSD